MSAVKTYNFSGSLVTAITLFESGIYSYAGTVNTVFNLLALTDITYQPSQRIYSIVNNSVANTITITPVSGELINGSATLVLSAGQRAEIYSNGSGYYTL